MFKEKMLTVIIGFILGVSMSYFYNDTQKNKIVTNKNQETIPKSVVIKDAISNKDTTSRKIPTYIKDSLRAHGVDTMQLTNKTWNEFLNKVQIDGIKGLTHSYASEGGYSLIHLLGHVGALDTIQNLLKKGFDINAKTNNGETPLLLSIRNISLDQIKSFIEMGADIHAKSDYGRDALASAFQHEFPYEKNRIIKYLLEEHGFSYVNNPEKYLSYMTSKDINEEYIMESLPYLKKENYENSIKTIFYKGQGNDEMVDFFIANNIEVDIDMLNTFTSSKKVSTEKIQSLIDKYSLDVNEKNQGVGSTPLMIAVKTSDIEKVELYLKNGANPLVTSRGQNSYGILKNKTPKYYFSTKEDRIKIKKLLDKYSNRS